ncbi:unnamed protein product [Chilo suppressalis]|uniref:Seminal fluid protein n=1 Tax=Chilo suppressalis TaxID=168631 RepID=A0ABN8B115_CHISP|nr:unnamed protein product [Chilo suppressalis]
MNLLGKVVIVTGASSGIGAKTAEFFCREGANVTLVARNKTKLKKTSEKCGAVGGKHIVIVGDVAKDEDTKRIIDNTIKEFGKLDVLVNNAAVGSYGNILDGTFMKSYDSSVDINLRAVLQLTCLAAPYLVKTKGNIVNISSIAGITAPKSTVGAYGLLKAALIHFSKIAAGELASSGIRVNTISPGPVYTDIIENSGGSFTFDNLRHATLLNRISEPDEIADLILYLASDKAKGITGSNFVVDNGSLLKRDLRWDLQGEWKGKPLPKIGWIRGMEEHVEKEAKDSQIPAQTYRKPLEFFTKFGNMVILP